MTMQDSAVTIEDVLALSPLQQGLFSRAVLGEADGGVDPYFITMAADVNGPLDVALLRGCADAMLVRHPNLRVSFAHRDLPHPVQIVPSQARAQWRHVGITEEQLSALESDERSRRFDLERGPLIRFLLAELGGARWRLVITAHHIVLDGWSLPVFISELVALYAAGGDIYTRPAAATLSRLHRLALGPRSRCQCSVVEGLLGRTARSHLSVAGTRARPAAGAAAPGRNQGGRPTDHAAGRGGAVARPHAEHRDADCVGDRARPFHRPRRCGLRRHGVGQAAELASVESMVGLFVNTVPLRVRLGSAVTVGQLCSTVQHESATLRDHGYLTHARLRSLGGVGEMFDTLLVYETFPPARWWEPRNFTQGR